MWKVQWTAATIAAITAITAVAIVQVDLAAQSPAPAAVLQRCLRNNGIGFTPFRDGQGPEEGVYPSLDQVGEDVSFLSRTVGSLRVYGTDNSLGEVARLAKARGLGVAQGVFIGKDKAVNERGIVAAIALANAGLVDSLIIGNEVLSFTPELKDDLVSYLRRVRQSVPTTVRVTTADIWSTWQANLDVAREADFILGHFYPFWENRPIDGAAARVLEEYRTLQAAVNAAYPMRTLPVVIGETGWPAAGTPRVPGVVPSPENQRRFFREFMDLACQAEIPFYYFGALDEEWKWREGDSNVDATRPLPSDRTFSEKWIGSSWGLFNANGTLKTHLADLLEPPAAPTTRNQRDILVDGALRTYYDAGVNSSNERHDWLSSADASLKMAYPADQDWGAVFFTVGAPVDLPNRPWKDFSPFDVLSVEMRGERGGEEVSIGVKTDSSPDDGGENTKQLTLTDEFTWQDIRLSDLASSRLIVPRDLARLYVVCEFVFSGGQAKTIYVRSVRYKPAS